MIVSLLKKYAKSLLEKEVCDESLESSGAYQFSLVKPLPLDTKSTDTPESHETPSLEKPLETVLSEGAFVKGELKFQKIIRIDGSFEGSLSSIGKLFVGPKGFIKADIILDDAIVQGTIVGNITVKKLTLLKGSEIIGDIKAEILIVEPGSKIIGQMSIGAEESFDNAFIYLHKDGETEESLQVSI